MRVTFSGRTGLKMSLSATILVGVLLIGHFFITGYLYVHKDNQLEKLRRQITVREGDIENLKSEIDSLENKIEDLKGRLKIQDVLDDFNKTLTKEEKISLGQIIYDESKQFGYDPMLLFAIILTESSFFPDSKSYKGARGLMQIMPGVGEALFEKYGEVLELENWDKDFHKDQLFDPEINLKLGVMYFSKLILKFEDVNLAIQAYHSGPARIAYRVKKGRRLPKAYNEKVMKNYKMLREKYNS